MVEKEYLDYKGLQHVAQNVNARLKSVLELPATAPDGTVYLYVGATDSYTKGHIYQYSESEEVWADISPQGSGGTGWDVVTVMPSVPSQGQVVLYEGHSTTQYAHGGVYRYNNNQWEFLGALIQLVEVPFTLSLASVQAISGGDTARVLTFTASAESDPTEETIAGVTANGVIQGKFWNDLAGSISQVNGTTFRVTLDTGVTDSLGQLAQFPEGSFVTIPAFSWVSGTTQYIHAAETISISETTVSQKLAFSTTGTLDSATQATRFNISSSYEIPFALTYSGISTAAMKDSNYNQEVTQSWTPSIVAANDSTELIFTPSTPSALHGDNIAITAGTLTAVASGVTYTYSFSTDNLTLRWGNTSYNLGTYNNFASMTARPTSANSGSVTCALTPIGPGSEAYQLAFMAELKPAVYIDGVECANVTWTQGEIVASGASGVTTVAGKTIDVVWAADTASDVDSYGISRTASVTATSLSATGSYIQQAVVLSSPSPALQNGALAIDLTADFSVSNSLTIASSDYSASATGIMQANTKTVNSDGAVSYSGTTFQISSFGSGVDNLGQRLVFPSGYGSLTIGAFDVYHGDYELTHSAQTLTVTETVSSVMKLDLNDTSVATWTTPNSTTFRLKLNSNITRGPLSNYDNKAGGIRFSVVAGSAIRNADLNITPVDGWSSSAVAPSYQMNSYGNFDLYWGDTMSVAVSKTPTGYQDYQNDLTAFGVSWEFAEQTVYLEPYATSLTAAFDNVTGCGSDSYDSGGSRHEFSGYPITGNAAVGELIKDKITVTITTSLGTYTPDLTNNYNVLGALSFAWNYSGGSGVPALLKADGTITISWNQFNESFTVPDSDGFTVYAQATSSKTVTGNHYYSSYYDDDDCDDD